MKLLYIETNSFIANDETKTFDFTDYLGRPHKVKGIWGRNDSGKTFIARSIEALFYPVEDNHLAEAIARCLAPAMAKVYIDLEGEQLEVNFPSSNLYQYKDKVLIYTPPPYVREEKPTEPTLKYLFRANSKHKYLSHGEFNALSIARFVEKEKNKLVIIDDADLHMDRDQLEKLIFYLQNKEDNNQYIIFFKQENPSFLYESEIICLRSC